MTRAHIHLFRLAALCLAPTLALAHPGHGEHLGFADGVLHPLTGPDGWQYAAGFMLSGLGLIAAAVATARFIARSSPEPQRSRTSTSGAAPEPR